MKKILIKTDLFDISKRLKKIDKNYYILFDRVSKKYQICFKNQARSKIAFVSDRLDGRVIQKALKTCIKFAKEIFQDIEKTNKKLNEKKQEYLIEKSKFELKKTLDYIDKTGKENFSSNESLWF